jgi:hypothetical protein
LPELLRRHASRHNETNKGKRPREMPGAFQEAFPTEGRIPLDGGNPGCW